jgi:hypothetical protein
MNLFFTILLLVLGVGGSLFIVKKVDEHDDKFTPSFLFLFTVIGVVMAIWGVILHLNYSYIYSTGRGPISGWQLIVLGTFLSLFCGFWTVKELRKNSAKK